MPKESQNQTTLHAPFLAKETGPALDEGFIETPDHVALHYGLWGHQGPFLVLCDGIGCDGFIWKYFIPDFAGDYRVLHWQYRGHGQSSLPLDYDSMTIGQMGQDLSQILQEKIPKGEAAVLLGHSMGVQVILEFLKISLKPPVAGLVALCGGPGNTLDSFLRSRLFKYLFPYLLQFFRSSPNLAEFIWNSLVANPRGYYPAILFQLISTLCSKEDLKPYLDHLGRIDPRVFMELASDMGGHSVNGFLEQIDLPVLVMAGSRDNFTPVARTKEIADKIPRAEFSLVPGGTHTAPLELPELFSLRIRKFLAERIFPEPKG